VNEFLRKLLFLPEQRSTLAQELDTLHYSVILTTMAGSIAVALAVFYFLVRYRESAGAAPVPPAEERPGISRKDVPLWFEIVVVAGLLGLFVLWWVIGFRQFVRVRTPPADAMKVYVIAKKWMWSFAYPSGDTSNAVLYVPVGRPVELVMTSRDVIHSFFVPEFRLKQDVVPGRVTTLWFEATEPGIYQLLCAEYCGTSHSTMRGRVIALPQAEYRARMEGLPALGEDSFGLAKMGEDVATRYGCLRCHTVDGTPHIGPTWARAYGSEVPLADGRTVIADEAYLTRSMMDPLADLHRGFEPVMPSYQGLLAAADTGALVEYIRSLRDVNPAARFSPMPQLAPGQHELRIQPTPERTLGLPSEPALEQREPPVEPQENPP
jgi:cytochrome c oxidase subunit 2